ncbi:hypothetical protein K474DRAFT_1655036 [Panus rudis PR-1116 ss-1]|nr:hypothetical protein K474DRAFT_1655036 [Panus rudis PR-1116 ss-1]
MAFREVDSSAHRRRTKRSPVLDSRTDALADIVMHTPRRENDQLDERAPESALQQAQRSGMR